MSANWFTRLPGCHRRRIPDRVVIDKLVQVLVFGCAYARIADATCSATTVGLLNIGVVQHYGIGPVFKGFASQIMQEIDVYVIEDMRSIQFPGAPPLDLVAVDLQRARDHGIPGYNMCRQCFGLSSIQKFQNVTSNVATQKRLVSTYSTVDEIDPLIGGLAEDHAPDSALGPLLRAVLIEQFTRLRAGDRYWYEHDPAFSASDAATLQGTKLSDVIKRNTEITNIQTNVFVLP